MTTTPGPLIDREALLAAIKAIPSPEIGGIAYRESHLLALIAEQPVIEAEARADVDGLVALPDAETLAAVLPRAISDATLATYVDGASWHHAIARNILALLAGDKAENWDDFEPLELLAGDKAESPE